MLGVFKRLWRRDGDAPRWPDLEPWAQARGRVYRRARDGAGFIVEGRYEDRPWRLEWGPSQRDYLVGQELRLRMDLSLPEQLQLLILSRELMRAMESETFQRYTDHLKTQIDASTPEEMRWLVMYPKLSLRGMPTLRGSIGAVASSLASMSRWLDGPLAEALEHETLLGALAAERPFVLMTSRHRLALRVELFEPRTDALDALIALFETAASRLPQALEGLEESNSLYPSTVLSGWLTDLPSESLGRPLSRSFGSTSQSDGSSASAPTSMPPVAPAAPRPAPGLSLGLLRAMGRGRKVPARADLGADTVTHIPGDSGGEAPHGGPAPDATATGDADPAPDAPRR